MNATVLKTIVSSGTEKDIAVAYDLETIDTLTGFKYISEWVKELEEIGGRCFLLGYEESYGYLIGEIGRDKDVVQSCLLIAEVAVYSKANNKTLYEGFMELYP